MKRIGLLLGALVVWSACTVQTEPLGVGPSGLPGESGEDGMQGEQGEPGEDGMPGIPADVSLFMRVDGDTGTVGNLRAGDDGTISSARLDVRGGGIVLNGLDIVDSGCDTSGMAQFSGSPDLSAVQSGDILVDEAHQVFTVISVDDDADTIGFGGTLSNCDAGGTYVAEIHRATAVFRGGGVGIGTDTPSPETILHVSGLDRSGHIRLERTGTQAGSWELGVSGRFTIRDNNVAAPDDIRFQIDNQGHVGIGTTSKDARLVVRQTDESSFAFSVLDPSEVPALRIYSVDTPSKAILIETSNTRHIVLNPSNPANVGIGVDNPAYRLDVNGDVNADCYFDDGVGPVAGTCSSDRRLKSNIRSLTNTLANVLRLNPVSFEYKDKLGVRQVGLVAQDVEKVLPHLVTEADGVKKVRYGMELQMMVLQAVKEQHAIIEEKNREIAAQRRRIGLLEKQLTRQDTRLRAIEARLRR